ncbi:PIKK family atypical protein kinase [Trichomonas vaginalis G3]|uniref:non-specific serine/threonine protein kinase n=1 Tax=Trichomonas vaginalis (strain ATCC PRA-98 / G3) TaxID=412133 RepID=A2DTB0_TRIV3|nr:ataxia telangiectasia mutated (ATM) -related family [Trichomonas vaginalis G3]EAY16382.1 PIKK family atypical protein kinase [Trichomonas vaginalis G3]KAI5488390.1 ataxia telangiectasia mutated (ATM) -related family [Trichomonas vaginalis G3]|eukprot:XP_001328605.1 PIKK family atypical protein kinase [Trichomonas vaginalis G3]
MNLTQLPIPRTSTEMTAVYKELKSICFENWCVLTYEEGHSQKHDFILQIQKCAQLSDPQNQVRACIGASIMVHYSTSWNDTIMAIFGKIEAGSNAEATDFICERIAKFTNKLPRTSNFLIQRLKYISKVLLQGTSKESILHCISLLNYLEKYAIRSLEACSLQYYEQIYPLLFNEREDLRNIAFHSLSHFLQISRRADFPSQLYKDAKSILDPPLTDPFHVIHGALLTYAAICDSCPIDLPVKQVQDQMASFWSMNTRDYPSYIKHTALIVVVILSPFDQTTFNNLYLQSVVSSLWPDLKPTVDNVDGLHILMRKSPVVFENRMEKLCNSFKAMFTSDSLELVESAVKLLNELLHKLPQKMNDQKFVSKLANILSISQYTESLIQTLKVIFDKYPLFWTEYKNYALGIVTRLFERKFTENALRLIIILPEVQDPPEYLYTSVLSALQSNDIATQILAPEALESLCRSQDDDVKRNYGKKLLSIAMTASSNEFRYYALKAFKPPYHHYLSYPDSLSMFDILIRDGNKLVCMEGLKILGGVSSYNPAMIYPIFRSLILDTLFITDSSKSSRVQADAIRCLPIIFSSVPPLLPVYDGQFLPIALQQLRIHLKSAILDDDDFESNDIRIQITPTSSLGSTSSFGSSLKKTQINDQPHPFVRTSPSSENLKQDLAQAAQAHGQRLSFFERTFSSEIAKDLINTISVIAKISFETAEPYIDEMTSIFIETLQRASQKSVILAILSALDVIVSKIGPKSATNFSKLYSTLISLGGRMMSQKVHSCIFKVLGQLGLILAPQEQIILDVSQEQFQLEFFLVGTKIEYEDYFIYVIFNALHSVIIDKLQQDHHTEAHTALVNIFTQCEKTISAKRMFNNYIKMLLPAVIEAPYNEKTNYFGMLKQLLQCPTEWLQPFASNFVSLIEEMWDSHYTSEVISLISPLAHALKEVFQQYIPKITTLLLDELSKPNSIDSTVTPYILDALTYLSLFAWNFVFIIVKQITDVVFNSKSNDIIEKSLDSLRSIVQNYDCASYSSSIIRACFFALNNPKEEIKNAAVQVLYSLAVSIGPSFSIFKTSVEKAMINAGYQLNELNRVAYLKTRGKHTDFPFIKVDVKNKMKPEPRKKIILDEESLINKISIPESLSVEHWKNWMQRFQKSFAEHSPSPAFRLSSFLITEQPLLLRKFFEPAFLSVWIVASDHLKEEIMNDLNTALFEKTTPMPVLTSIIGLFEFMDRTKQELPKPKEPFKLTRIVLRAEKPTYALYCAEQDYIKYKDDKTAQNQLIQIYTQLGMFDESRGFAQTIGDRVAHMSGQIVRYLSWDNSLEIVHQSTEDFMAKLSFLEEQEKWPEIAKLAGQFSSLSFTEKDNAALIFAHAFYHLNDWSELEKMLGSTQENIGSTVIRIMAKIKNGDDINNDVEKGFIQLGNEAGSLFAHGITAVAPFIVFAQRLIELKEATQGNIRKTWAERLMNNAAHFNMIRSILLTRCEVLGPSQNVNEDLAFLKFARRSNEWDAFKDYFDRHFQQFEDRMKMPRVIYENALLLSKIGQRDEASVLVNSTIERLINSHEDDDLIAKLYMLKAKWKIWLIKGDSPEVMHEVRNLLSEAIKYRPMHYMTNNMWAWSNMKLASLVKEERVDRAIDAIIAFAHCVLISPKNCFADLLQLSSILFTTHSFAEIYETTKSTIAEIPIKNFITILPQLVVYQYTESQSLRTFVEQILTRLLNEYPNATIFPLLFAANLGNKKSIVRPIINSFELTNAQFTHSAKTILTELCRLGMTYPEYICEALTALKDRTDKALANPGNTNSLDEIVDDLLERLKLTTCEYDRQAQQRYSDTIKTLETILNNYKTSKKPLTLSQRSQEIRLIMETFNNEFKRETKLNLKYYSPDLAAIENSPITVFGRFRTEGNSTTILRFGRELNILNSKRRPRQLKIVGSDHVTYKFLLKGHEDLRQDQRVMQFFELVNSISHNVHTRIAILSITPLSPRVGLIQWLPGCDTMSELIDDYRSISSIKINVESKMLEEYTIPDYDSLQPIQRYEYLIEVDKNTSPDDLKNIMWLKAPDAEAWVNHTSHFSRSTALMSIVGYIIGLGDRHPSNIMIQRYSGSVIHIDFGDCFEVTAKRAQLAETIPFRLTRMIVKALGQCGVNGSFRRVCQDTLQTLRGNREAVMAVLEIFFREPLSSGRLFESKEMNENIVAGSLNNNMDSLSRKNLAEIMTRISDKVRGTDNNNTVPMTVHEQVDWLIKSARDMYNLSCLFRGWNPLW